MRRFALGSVLLLALFAWGCGSDSSNPTSPTDPAGAAAEAAAGDQALADGDVAGANTHYKAALAKDPDNAQANIGAAVTEVALLQSDSEIDSLIRIAGGIGGFPVRGGDLEAARSPVLRVMAFGDTRFAPFSPVKAVARLTTLGTDDPPLLSDVQRAIRLKVMPKLAYAEARLNVVELHPTWRYLVPPAVTDQPDTVELDLGEVYALDAVINAVQGWLGIAISYDFDVPSGGPVNAESLLANGTDFGTLHTDGALQLLAARSNFMVAKSRLDAAVAFIAGETDNQENDVIPQSALADPQFQQWREQFNQVQSSLSSPITVPVNDYQNIERMVSIELGKFFTNSIADFKTKLPDHTFDLNHEPVVTDPITFPDPEFNQIFPEMTNEAWRQLIGPVNPPPPTLVSRR
jgi:hypothetical protein